MGRGVVGMRGGSLEMGCRDGEGGREEGIFEVGERS